MIIKGGSRSNGGFFARHLTNDRGDEKTGNDRAELCDMRGVTANTVDGFFREIAAVASGTRCKNNFYHASISPEISDQLTPEQRLEAVDMLERNLGLAGQPRFVMEHEKEGRVHQHVIWSRIDPETMKARADGLTYRIHERTSREIEERFDLVRGRSTLDPDREGPRPERRPPDWEGFRASQKVGIDPAEMRAEFTELWQTTDSGKAFAAAIEERGYMLARGDQRGYVVLDHAGDVHSLARCVEGVKTAGVRERMADVPLASLPSVTEAREQQRAPFTRDGSFDREAAVQAWQDRGYEARGRERDRSDPEPGADTRAKPQPARELGRDAGNIRQAWDLSDSGRGFADELQNRGYLLAEVSPEEARDSERAGAFVKEVGRYSAPLKEGELVAVNGFGRVTRINERTTGDTREGIEQHLAGIDRRSLMNVADTRDVMIEVSRQQFYAEKQTARPLTGIETTIVDALEKRRSLDSFGNQLDSAGLTIARVTAADIVQLRAEHWERAEKLDQWEQRDPRRMNEGDLFAVTRTGKAFALNPFRMDFQKIEQSLSDEGRLLPSVAGVREAQASERADRAEARAQRDADYWARKEAYNSMGAPDGRARAEGRGPEVAGRVGFQVVDGMAQVAGKLADFVADLLSFGATESKEERPKAHPHMAEIERMDRAERALENIRDSIERGDGINAQDLRNLTPEHKQGIASGGDDYLRWMVQHEEEREHDLGRERER